MNARVSILALTLVTLTTGCAGGLRDGTAPLAGSGARAAPAAPKASSDAGGADATRATADGVRFVCRAGGSTAAVAGEFNAWNATADPMTKQADGSFVLVKKLEPGRHPYKFVIDGTNWKEDPNAKASVDDNMGGKNSVIEVGTSETSALAASAGAGAAPPAAGTATMGTGKAKPPEVTADGVRFTFAGAASSVHLAGEFNGWAANLDPLTRQADGSWTIVKKLPPGKHPYKFLLNGATWRQDEANPDSAEDGFGGKSSIVTVP